MGKIQMTRIKGGFELPKPPTKRVNSRAKGASGERELANKLAELTGFAAKRGQQHKGGEDSPDVVTTAPFLAHVHFEVKREKNNGLFQPAKVAGWLLQARRDAGPNRLPVVAHRWNGSRAWFVIVARPKRFPIMMPLESFILECQSGHWRLA